MESKMLLYLDLAHKIDGRVVLTHLPYKFPSAGTRRGSARGRGPTFKGLTSRGVTSKSCLRNIFPAVII